MTELGYWTEQVKRGRISRREFMGRAAALGITTALATSLLNEAGVAAEPKKGGSARFGLAHGATTDTMDPAAYPDTGTQVPFWGSMSNSLTEVDAKGNITMDLCESMESADGAKKWVCKLRKGVTFHNGKDFTADDVVGSFRYHMGADSKSAAKAVLEQVDDIKPDDKQTVIFTLKGGNADFPYVVSDYHIPILPSENGVGDWRSGVRTGPFTLVSYEPGVRAKLKRNPNYHKPGRPYFDDVEFLTIADVTARTNALTTGEVHWISRADLKTLNLLSRNPDVAITEVTGYGHYVFPMDVTAPPFDNVDVRTALKWALNREDIAKKVFLGHAVVGNDSPIAPSVKFAADPKPRYTYDPDKAKFHLQKAGMQNLKVNLSVADTAFNGAIDAGVLYQEHAKAAGIDINVVREPNDGYWDNVWLKKPWCADYWGGRPTCDWMFTVVYAKGAAWNETKWANPRFNDLLVIARAETDEKKRADMYAELQQLVHDDGGAVVLVFNNYVDAHSKKVAHGEIAPNWEVDGLRIAERWWFA
ncbi:MAG: ABC transporter substrate-binding protein [Hyphomicrobiales bacterium]|nr:ABC transporter substrate-binding protein [Hyphomicrobiales bacterium]MBV9591432.1 ABC transporter substrate-binding protein [Hyphomicrobiales bacterium]